MLSLPDFYIIIEIIQKALNMICLFTISKQT